MITKTKTFSYKRLELCRNCRGERYVTISESAKHVEYAVCPVCMGTGRVLKTIEGTITVDFDGTLCRDAFPAIGEMQPGADTALAALRREGHYIIINTCRRGDDLTAAVNWLLEQRIPFDRVNDNHPDLIARYGGNTRKIHADLYIDDHNLGGFPGWDATLHTIGSIWQDTDY